MHIGSLVWVFPGFPGCEFPDFLAVTVYLCKHSVHDIQSVFVEQVGSRHWPRRVFLRDSCSPARLYLEHQCRVTGAFPGLSQLCSSSQELLSTPVTVLLLQDFSLAVFRRCSLSARAAGGPGSGLGAAEQCSPGWWGRNELQCQQQHCQEPSVPSDTPRGVWLLGAIPLCL